MRENLIDETELDETVEDLRHASLIGAIRELASNAESGKELHAVFGRIADSLEALANVPAADPASPPVTQVQIDFTEGVKELKQLVKLQKEPREMKFEVVRDNFGLIKDVVVRR